MKIPPKLPTTGPFKRLYGWLNDLRDYVQSLRPLNSSGTETQQTAVGTIISANKKTVSDSASASAPRWG